MKNNSNDGRFLKEAKMINAFHYKAVQRSKDALLYSRDAGEWLDRVHSALNLDWNQKGVENRPRTTGAGFSPWVEKNLEVCPAKAWRYIRIFRNWEMVKDCPTVDAACLMISRKIGSRHFGEYRGGMQKRNPLLCKIREHLEKWTSEERLALNKRPDIISAFLGEMRSAIQSPVFAKAA